MRRNWNGYCDIFYAVCDENSQGFDNAFKGAQVFFEPFPLPFGPLAMQIYLPIAEVSVNASFCWDWAALSGFCRACSGWAADF